MDIINPEANEVGRSGPYIHLPAVFMEREMFVSDVGIRTCLPKALWILTRCLGPLSHAVTFKGNITHRADVHIVLGDKKQQTHMDLGVGFYKNVVDSVSVS